MKQAVPRIPYLAGKGKWAWLVGHLHQERCSSGCSHGQNRWDDQLSVWCPSSPAHQTYIVFHDNTTNWPFPFWTRPKIPRLSFGFRPLCCSWISIRRQYYCLFQVHFHMKLNAWHQWTDWWYLCVPKYLQSVLEARNYESRSHYGPVCFCIENDRSEWVRQDRLISPD